MIDFFAKAKPMRRRKITKPTLPAHNFMDAARAIREIAEIIDPDAFRAADSERCAIAMQKARDAVAAYDRILGNYRKTRMIIKSGRKMRVFTSW